MNVIGAQIRDPINSGQTRWQLKVDSDIVAESGGKESKQRVEASQVGMVPTHDIRSTASRYSSCSTPTQRSTRLDRKQKEYLASP